MKKDNVEDSKTHKGFASMPSEEVREIAKKGGQASAEKAGHEGMAERGRQGGQARSGRSDEEEEDSGNKD